MRKGVPIPVYIQKAPCGDIFRSSLREKEMEIQFSKSNYKLVNELLKLGDFFYKPFMELNQHFMFIWKL